MPQWSADDVSFMALALSLARGQLGKTATNPAVGCVIVKNGQILGQGATAQGGRPHGEAMALVNAKGPVDGATVYVTLEPCNHISDRGPSCAASLVNAKIARLVCCLKDPDPRTAGKGFERLRHAGIIVHVGLLEDEGTRQIADFSTKLKN